jgi:hypothetical protein
VLDELAKPAPNHKGFSLTTEALCSQQACAAGQNAGFGRERLSYKTAYIEVLFALALLKLLYQNSLSLDFYFLKKYTIKIQSVTC